MPCSRLLIVMATLLIGTSTVRDCRHGGDGQNCREYEGDNFHSSLPVIVILCFVELTDRYVLRPLRCD
jgi:hypothetical protein